MHSRMSIDSYHFDDDVIKYSLDSSIPAVKVYRPVDRMVVLGRGSKVDDEIRIDGCLKDGIHVLRRRGGGCSVVLDPGNVVVSIALPADGIGQNRRYFRSISEELIRILHKIGLGGIYQDGISDLVMEDMKIAGASIYRTKGLLFYSAALLVNSDLSLIEKYLKHPPREPEYRKSRQHLEFVRSLFSSSKLDDAMDVERELGKSLDPNVIWKKISFQSGGKDGKDIGNPES